jgi:hypothetical protein
MMKRAVFCILLFGLVMGLFAQSIPTYTAREYVNLWDENKLKAEQLYKGKQMRITGVVLRVDRAAFSNNPYVDLDLRILFFGLTCEFPESAINSIANLEKGQTVTITGYAESQFRIIRCSIK